MEPFLDRQSVGLKASAIVVLEVIDAPFGVLRGVKLLVAVASRCKVATVDARVTI